MLFAANKRGSQEIPVAVAAGEGVGGGRRGHAPGGTVQGRHLDGQQYGTLKVVVTRCQILRLKCTKFDYR